MYNLREDRVRIKLLQDLKELQLKHNVSFYELEYCMNRLNVDEILKEKDFN